MSTGTKLNPVALGLSLGILWGVTVLLLGLMAVAFAYGEVFVASAGAVYIGYGISILGSILGGIISFIHAFICGVIIAWLYNKFEQTCCQHKATKD